MQVPLPSGSIVVNTAVETRTEANDLPVGVVLPTFLLAGFAFRSRFWRRTLPPFREELRP
jgi:hypothetical protein